MDSSGNWVQTKAPDPGTDQATIAQARRALAEARYQEAQRILDEWLRLYERSKNPILPEALELRGDALTALGQEFQALYDYERVIKEFPSTTTYVVCVERELDIAVRYVQGYRRLLFGFRVLAADDLGEELLIRVQERMPGSRLAERAGIELADYYYNDHNLALAAEAYDLFVQNYPNSQYAMKARERRIYATIGRYKGPAYDASALLDSKILIRRFANRYPAEAQSAGLDEALLVRLDESGAEHMLGIAEWYLRRLDYISAKYVLRRLIKEHPRTAAAAKALETMQSKGWSLTPPVTSKKSRNALVSDAAPTDKPATSPDAGVKSPDQPAPPSAPSPTAPEKGP